MARPVIAVLNGPNLDILGRRDPEQYGTVTLAEIEAIVHTEAAVHGLEADFRQTNREGEPLGEAAGVTLTPMPEVLSSPPQEQSVVPTTPAN